MSFFHGIKTENVDTPGGTIKINRSSVIALIGAAPIGTTQSIVLCNGPKDDAQFGEPTPDNQIGKTLDIIRKTVRATSKQPSDGSCPVIVINVTPSGADSTVEDDDYTLSADGTFQIGKYIYGNGTTSNLADVAIATVSGGVPTAYNEAAEGTAVYGKDYTFDRYGNFKVLGSYTAGTTFRVISYKCFEVGTIAAADIIGEVGADNSRTGSYLLELVESELKFKPKVIISPIFNTLTGVSAALESLASSMRGIYISDAEALTTYPEAIALRATGGHWATQNAATVPCYPWMKAYDTFAKATISFPYAAYLAAICVTNDANLGFWASPSNQPLPTVTGPETTLTVGYSNPNSEINELNARGIVTYNTGYGLGMLTWGNRNASFPTSSDVRNFINIYRADGMIADAMEEAGRPYVDKSITKALIDVMKQVGNNFMKSLIQQGAVLPGSQIKYLAEDNSSGDLADGKLKFRRVYMIPTPAESITFMNILDINLLG